MAPGADIISYAYEWNGVGMLFYNNPGDIEADWAAAQNTYGADVGNASLGSNIYANYPLSCTLMGNYGVTEVLMDQIIRGGNAVVGVGDKYIATWAHGNERRQRVVVRHGYGTTAPPAAAKNPIHVGASNTNDNSMTTFSSWGPTDDGRIKPIVVAGGEQIGGDGGIKSTVPECFHQQHHAQLRWQRRRLLLSVRCDAGHVDGVARRGGQYRVDVATISHHVCDHAATSGRPPLKRC